ncbi:MAG: GNAT family N-acetyltransferase [Azonexus sp.]|nr:GNAT family N-acetyltransferase [Azonexus sp.]
MSTIRAATPDDIDTLVEMGREFFASAPYSRFIAYDPDSIRDAVIGMVQFGCALVAEAGGQIVGFIVGHMAPTWFNRSQWVATEFAWWVAPDHRGSTAGVRLLQAFEAWGVSRGAVAVVMSDLILDDGGAPAGRIFDRLGYAVVERSHAKGI